jgi:hypothetical protein
MNRYHLNDFKERGLENVRLQPSQLAALDAWIGRHEKHPPRGNTGHDTDNAAYLVERRGREAGEIPQTIGVVMATGYINIFEDRDGRRYPSGIMHKTEAAAKAAQKNPDLEGEFLDLQKVIYNDSSSKISPGQP